MTLLKDRWVEPAVSAGSGAICVALLQSALVFPFHQYAINAIDLVTKRLEQERALDETECPFTLFFPPTGALGPQEPLAECPVRAPDLDPEQVHRNVAEHPG